ncbi:Rap1a/Tai family immunity protein [Zavarzinia sp. CC-PAN008]|uniref:Rap1a/Tai family immunity protein n=1 Tax=Zavarzinia sp. CC-PAN008 TaxID=3243332 RepID=UPI003F742BDB
MSGTVQAQSGPSLPPPAPSPMDQTGVRTAGELLQTCRHGARPDELGPEDASKARVCKAYMVAFFQNEVANPPLDAGSRLCLMGDISFNRMAEMVRDYGDVRPELNGAPADQLMRASLQANYPCPQQPGN